MYNYSENARNVTDKNLVAPVQRARSRRPTMNRHGHRVVLLQTAARTRTFIYYRYYGYTKNACISFTGTFLREGDLRLTEGLNFSRGREPPAYVNNNVQYIRVYVICMNTNESSL